MAEDVGHRTRPRGYKKYRYWNLWYYWTDNTTLHGVKYIGERDSFPLRRYIWLAIVLIALAFFIKYVVERIEYYQSSPVNVNVEIKEQSQLRFPTLTLCNQNLFSLTKAVEAGYFHALNTAYGSGKDKLASIPSHHSWVYNLTMDEIYSTAGYDIKEMILECTWHGVKCDHRDFIPIITDHGKCYSFNDRGSFIIRDTGATNGLQMTLNIQQYNYMIGPFKSAGIRLHLHENDTVPVVTDLGLSAAVGKHTFIAVKEIKTSSLPPPYGHCGESDSYPDKEYSASNCIIICRFLYYKKKCGCREAHMVNTILSNGEVQHFDDVPVCTLFQQMTCIPDASRKFNLHHRLQCKCPMACQESYFEPTLSFTSISMLGKKEPHRTQQPVLNHLKDSLTQARDYQSVLEKDIHRFDSALLSSLLVAFRNRKNLSFQEIPYLFALIRSDLQKEFENVMKVSEVKKNLFLDQQLVVDELFVRGFQTADERTLSLVGHEMYEFAFYYQQFYQRLSELPKDNEKPLRDTILQEALILVQTKQRCIEAAIHKMKELIDCYTNGVPYFDKFPSANPLNWSQALAAIPRRLLFDTVNGDSNVQTKLNIVTEHLKSMLVVVMKLADILREVYNTGKGNSESVDNFMKQFLNATKVWLNDRGTLLHPIFRQPSVKMKDRLARLDLLQVSIIDVRDFLLEKFASLTKLIEKGKVHENSTSELESFVTNYLSLDGETLTPKNFIYRKSDLGKQLGSMESEMDAEYTEHKLLSERLNQQYMDMPLALRYVTGQAVEMWTMIHADVDAQQQYQYHQLNVTLRMSSSLESIQNEMNEKSQSIMKGVLTLRMLDHDNINHLRKIQMVIKVFKQYYDSLNIITNFYKANTLKLSLFFRELNIEIVSQNEAYEFTSLLSDLGGQMGLFLGAGLLSLVEILDVAIQMGVQTKHQRNGTYDYVNDRSFCQHKKPKNVKEGKEKSDEIEVEAMLPGNNEQDNRQTSAFV